MDANMEITFPGNLKVDAAYKGFTVHTDQPRKEGGDGTAPEPFDLFLSSIGTCAGVYLLFFCQERQIDTRGIRLNLGFNRNRATRMVENISIRIQLPASFPEKYKKALVRVVGMCTVKKHLQQPPDFEIKTELIT